MYRYCKLFFFFFPFRVTPSASGWKIVFWLISAYLQKYLLYVLLLKCIFSFLTTVAHICLISSLESNDRRRKKMVVGIQIGKTSAPKKQQKKGKPEHKLQQMWTDVLKWSLLCSQVHLLFFCAQELIFFFSSSSENEVLFFFSLYFTWGKKEILCLNKRKKKKKKTTWSLLSASNGAPEQIGASVGPKTKQKK